MRQLTLASQGRFERYGKKTRREEFLEEMDGIMPWSELESLIEPHYPKEGNGRPQVGLRIMLRGYFLQHWFNLSDPAAEEALYDSPALRRFAGVDLGRGPAPDETTILNFRHLLEKHDLCGDMLEAVNHYLEGRGIRIVIESARMFDQLTSTMRARDGRSRGFSVRISIHRANYVLAVQPLAMRILFRPTKLPDVRSFKAILDS